MSVAGGRISKAAGTNLLGANVRDRNTDATCYIGNLEPQVDEELLWEIFVQAGPVVNVYLPKDRVTNAHQGYGFIEFRTEQDADYAIKILNMIKLFDRPIKVNKSQKERGDDDDVGANLFVGNLDSEVDEKYLYDTFSAFGVVTRTPKVMRDPDTGASRGFGFVSFLTFEASDAAIESMNGQFLCNRPVSVNYAFKRDGRGERHGTPAERLLASKNGALRDKRPHTLFSSRPGQVGPSGGMQPPPPPPPAGFPPGMGGGVPPGIHMPPPPPPPGMGGAPPNPYPMGNGMLPPPPPPMHAMGMYNTNGGPPPPPPNMQPPPPPPPM